MKRPPMLMHVKIRGEGRGFGLWLPLFLLLPLALFIIVSPLILIAILVFWPRGWRKRALHIFGAAFEVVSSMRNLKVDIQGGRNCIYISAV